MLTISNSNKTRQHQAEYEAAFEARVQAEVERRVEEQVQQQMADFHHQQNLLLEQFFQTPDNLQDAIGVLVGMNMANAAHFASESSLDATAATTGEPSDTTATATTESSIEATTTSQQVNGLQASTASTSSTVPGTPAPETKTELSATLAPPVHSLKRPSSVEPSATSAVDTTPSRRRSSSVPRHESPRWAPY